MGKSSSSPNAGSLSNFIFGESNRHVSSGSWGVQSYPKVQYQELKAKDHRLDMMKLSGSLSGMFGDMGMPLDAPQSQPQLQSSPQSYPQSYPRPQPYGSSLALPAPKSSVIVEDVEEPPFGLRHNDELRQVPNRPKTDSVFPYSAPSATDMANHKPWPKVDSQFPTHEPLYKASIETIQGEEKYIRTKVSAGVDIPKMTFAANSKATGGVTINLLDFTAQVKKDGDVVDPGFSAGKALVQTDSGYTVKATNLGMDGSLFPFAPGGATGSGKVNAESVTVSNDYLGGASLRNVKAAGDLKKGTFSLESEQLVGRGSMDAEGILGKVDNVTVRDIRGDAHYDKHTERVSGTMTANEIELQMDAINVNLSSPNIGFTRQGSEMNFEGNVDKLSIFSTGSNPITVNKAKIKGKPSADTHNWFELKARGIGVGYKKDLGPSLHPMHIVAEAPLSWANTLGNMGGFKSGWNAYKIFTKK